MVWLWYLLRMIILTLRDSAYSTLIRKIVLILASLFSGIALQTYYIPVIQNYSMESISDIFINKVQQARHLPKYGYLLSTDAATDLLANPYAKIVQPSYHQLIGNPEKVFLNNINVVIRVKATAAMNIGTIAYRIDGGRWFHVDLMTLEASLPLNQEASTYRTIILPARSIRIPSEDRAPVVDVRWVRFYKIFKMNIPFDLNNYEE